jgi:predicted transcriptional regulator
MADDTTRMTIRLPDDLYERLKRAAERERRSAHAQMLAYIERGLDQDKINDREEEQDQR